MAALDTYLLGDLNGDRRINGADYVSFRTFYDQVNGVGAFRGDARGRARAVDGVAWGGGLWAVRKYARELSLVRASGDAAETVAFCSTGRPSASPKDSA